MAKYSKARDSIQSQMTKDMTGKKCPTFNKVIDYISNFFNMDIKATRLNYYKDSNDLNHIITMQQL